MMWEDKCTRLEEQATREATRRGVVRVWVMRERVALGWVIVTPDVPMDRVCRAMPPGTKEGACTRACVAVWRSAPAAKPIAERAAIVGVREAMDDLM